MRRDELQGLSTGQRIMFLRVQRRLSRSEVCRRWALLVPGMPPLLEVTLRGWETRGTDPGMKWGRPMAKLLGCRVDLLHPDF